jgi:L-lactate dehydrogenase complex protein LldG
MSSRDAILKTLAMHKPDPVALPTLPDFGPPPADLAGLFSTMIESIHGKVFDVASEDALASALATLSDGGAVVGSTLSRPVPGAVPVQEIADPHDLAGLDWFVCAGRLGVVENGAIWVQATQLIHRAAPFLTQHLAIVLNRRDLVWTLHDAYRRLRIDEDGFGVFIAGPSKTADIEQALVIGAHGPRSLTVFLTDMVNNYY